MNSTTIKFVRGQNLYLSDKKKDPGRKPTCPTNLVRPEPFLLQPKKDPELGRSTFWWLHPLIGKRIRSERASAKPYRRNMLSHLTTIYQSSEKYEPRIKHLFTICHSIFRETLQDIPMWRFPKSWGYPQIIHFSRIFHYKPSIWE